MHLRGKNSTYFGFVFKSSGNSNRSWAVCCGVWRMCVCTFSGHNSRAAKRWHCSIQSDSVEGRGRTTAECSPTVCFKRASFLLWQRHCSGVLWHFWVECWQLRGLLLKWGGEQRPCCALRFELSREFHFVTLYSAISLNSLYLTYQLFVDIVLELNKLILFSLELDNIT